MDLNQITIPSLNVERSLAFYQELGLILIVDALPRYVRLQCTDGSSTLSISLDESFRTNDGIKIYFENKNLDEKVASLKKKGINFISNPVDKSWLWREAHLLDPDGHIIILYYAGDNRLNPPWKVRKN